MATNINHYIDNEKFFDAMCEWKKEWQECMDIGEERPPVSEYIGECFVKIAKNLVRRPNFMNYPYKDDMVGDGIENCLLYCYNFDPEKSKNPFSYFTQIIYYAFIRRIQKEKKENYIKYKKLKEMDRDGTFAIGFFDAKEKEYHEQQDEVEDKKKSSDDPYAKMLDLNDKDIDQFKTKEKKKKKKKKTTLFDGEDA